MKLFEVFGLCFVECKGGYICVLKVGFCYGDMVLMVIIEFVECDVDVKGVVDKVCLVEEDVVVE